jgi:hypothetical protein
VSDVPVTEYLVAEVLSDGRHAEAATFADQLEARAYAEMMAQRTGKIFEVFLVLALPS